jgi:predicted flap endonuclease-1-like 5' DNA nuclease
MRSDYALYVLAIILFILSGVMAAYQAQEQQLWIVTTAVLGFVFMGLGYLQRPKHTTIEPTATITTQPPLSSATQPTVREVEEKGEKSSVEIEPSAIELTKVKGIGEKRAQQLRTLGISSVEDLAKASEKDLARKLKISSKITGKWIGNAKEIVEKS